LPILFPAIVVDQHSTHGLVRKLELRGDFVGREKEEGLSYLWKDADPDIPILRQAKQNMPRSSNKYPYGPENGTSATGDQRT